MKKKIKKTSLLLSVSLLVIFNFSIALGESGNGGDDPQCDSGGPGSTSCSISYSGGINGGGFGGNGSGECSVTCGTGYYSCCYLDFNFPFFHCKCKSNNNNNPT